MNHFGEEIRHLRELNGLLQKQVASILSIDAPMLSRIERGERQARRSQIPEFSRVLDAPEEHLLALWLADKVAGLLQGEKVALEALSVVETDLKNPMKPII